MKWALSLALAALMGIATFGCGRAEVGKPVETPKLEATPEPPAPKQPEASSITEDQLRAALRAKNPGFAGQVGIHAEGRLIVAVGVNDPAIEDITALAGLPLRVLDLRGCHVTDISALKGMPLQELYLEDTGVRNISILKGMPLAKLYLSNTRVEDLGPLSGTPTLRELNVVGTQVSDLRALRGMPQLEMLWLTGCPLQDISPLQGVPSLISLTIAETNVSDLSPLKGLGLQRLHIAHTKVTDLTPLQWMRLTRLIFTPGNIDKGIQFARNMPTITQIDTRFDDQYTRPMGPSQFWSLYDARELK